MKIYLLSICLFCFAMNTRAQKTRVMAFPITDYIIVNDSSTITQVKLPAGLEIKDKSVCVIKSVYSSTKTDSVVTVGSGKCRLIKGDYYYFGFHKKDLKRKPVAGELLYTNVTVLSLYEGLLFDVLSNSITLQSVEEKLMADMNTALQLKTAADEKTVFIMMVADVKYTGTEMAKINNIQDVMISSGRFNGKKIFASMQAVTNDDVAEFLKYIKARPAKYAGNTWKFSEIMATWMAAGAPQAVD